MGRFLAAVSALVSFVAAKEYQCPEYEAIRQPSVAADKFDVSELAGVWYLIATTEPTTKFCLCNVMEYHIYQKTYLYADTCFETLAKKHVNITMENMGGDLSSDSNSPGMLHEGIKIKNHTVTPKSPTMVFNVRRDHSGKATLMHVYACLGKLPPIVGKNTFSYLLYSRTPWVSKATIDTLVAEDKRTGLFDLDEYVVTEPDTWRTCGVLPNKTDSAAIVV